MDRIFKHCAFFFTIASCLILTQCSHEATKSEGAEGLFAQAEESYKSERYLIALEKYRDLKNRYPYSNRAIDSELRIADVYFEQENYIEAVSAYEIFRELHPSHPKSDYVQYRIAMAYYNQIPSNTARDVSQAYRAIDAFNLLLEQFSGSSYSEKARECLALAKKAMAEQEQYVADFYFDRQHYLSASYRYAALLQDFPNMGFDEEALFRLGYSYFYIKMFNNAKDTLSQYVHKYPNGSWTGDAKSILGEITRP